MGYLPQIDVVLIHTDGVAYPLKNVFINLINVTAGTALSDLETDEYGVIAEGSVTGSAGDVVELSHDDYPLTQQFILGATQADAYLDNPSRLVVQNSYTEALEATEFDIYVKADNDTAPILLGSGRPGETVSFPYQSIIPTNAKVYAVAKGSEFVKTENAFLDSEATTVAIPATRSQVSPLFDRVEDATTVSTSTETLWSDTIAAGTLSRDGDKIWWQYNGRYANNSNAGKYVIVEFAGGGAGESLEEDGNDTAWSADGWIVRESNSVVRVSGEFTTEDSVHNYNSEITGLDLDNNDYNMLLRARTVVSAGDVIAKGGGAVFFPSANSAPVGVLLGGGVPLMGGGVYLTV